MCFPANLDKFPRTTLADHLRASASLFDILSLTSLFHFT